MKKADAIAGSDAAAPAPPEGNWAEWNQVWSGFEADTPEKMLYVVGPPRNLRQFWQRCYFEDLWALLGPGASRARCLELGSGRGTTSMYLAAQGCEVTMVDLAPAAFQRAARNFQAMRLPLPKMFLANACNTGLPSGRYDCVYNIGLLEHFDDPRSVLSESWRLLAPGGLLFSVIVPQVPTSRKWLTELLFAPWRLAMRPVWRSARRLRQSTPPPQAQAMVRTGFARSQYERWMLQIGAGNVQCIPYNPYAGLWMGGLSIGPFLQLYRWHHGFRQRLPRLNTWASVASCDLLWGRKP